MPFNTRNPIPSGDLRDLDDNARNIDTWANDRTKLRHPDRFGVKRRTWHGIEQEANLNIQQAIDAKNAAQEAAMMSGFSKYADTVAQLEAGIGTDYVDGDVVLVFQDESRGSTSSIYKVESGVAVFKNAFDKTRQDLLSFTGNISADAEWSDVPAHSDSSFDAQAQALANRTEALNKRTEGLLNVRAFIDTPIDGVTSNQDGIVAAVADAFATGADLFWPRGTYLSTDNIPNFWNVNHVGPGVLRRGDVTFLITPRSTHTNTIYLSPTGGGDGLSPAHGMSVGSMPNALRSLGSRASNGNWRVLFTAGTYTNNGIQPSFLPTFTRGLTLEGEMSGTTHLSVWDGSTSSSAYAVRIDLVSLPQMLTVKNMRFINWTANPSNAGAIVAWGGHNLVTENCRIESCSIGIWTSRNSQHRSLGDYIDGCSTFGIACQYNSSVVVGYSDKRTIIKNCGTGLHIGRASIGHNDYADFEGNQYDLYVTQNSRITHLNPTFKNWVVASHFIQNGAVDEAIDVCTFDAASISDAKPILFTQNSPIIDVVMSVGTEVLHTNYAPTSAFTLTGTTDETLLTAQPGYGAITRFPRNLMFCGRNLYIRFQARVQGANTGTGATFRIAGHGSSASLDILTFRLPSGGYVGFIEAHIEFRDDGTALAYGTLTTQSGVVFANKTMTPSTRDLLRDKTNTPTLWRLYAKLENIDDNFTMFTQKTWVTV